MIFQGAHMQTVPDKYFDRTAALSWREMDEGDPGVTMIDDLIWWTAGLKLSRKGLEHGGLARDSYVHLCLPEALAATPSFSAMRTSSGRDRAPSLRIICPR
jgi:hypothetical protein